MFGEAVHENRARAQASEPLSQSVRWLAYYTSPRHEKAVARQFEYRSVDCFLPLIRQPRRWKNGVRAQEIGRAHG